MDNDQIQGNPSVQGGNPESAVPAPEQAAPAPIYTAPANMIPETPGATPLMVGVPRSSIAQAAAEQAARDAVAAEQRKKIDPKILIGIIACIAVIIGSVVVIAIDLMNPPKKGGKSTSGSGSSSSSNAAKEDELKKEVEPEVEMQRIGSVEHGYISVPKEWTRDVEAGGLTYASSDKTMSVAMNSVALTATDTAKAIADNALARAKITPTLSQPQMTIEKHGTISMYKVYSYNTQTKMWSFEFLFDGEDQRVHSIIVYATDNTSDLLNTIPSSWSVNQNLESTSTTEK